MKHKQNVKNVKIFLLGLLTVFLLFNLISSQLISPLYLYLMAENKNSAIIYLQKIKELPMFQKELEKYKSIYGLLFEKEVFKPELERDAKIKSLKAALSLNSKSRDALYGLYLLYKEKGDQKTAEKYFRQTKELDPNVVE